MQKKKEIIEEEKVEIPQQEKKIENFPKVKNTCVFRYKNSTVEVQGWLKEDSITHKEFTNYSLKVGYKEDDYVKEGELTPEEETRLKREIRNLQDEIKKRTLKLKDGWINHSVKFNGRELVIVYEAVKRAYNKHWDMEFEKGS